MPFASNKAAPWVLGALVAAHGCADESSQGADPGTSSGSGTADAPTEGTDGETGATAGEPGETSGGPTDEGPWSTFEERPCPDDSFVTFENFGWPHMLTFCNGCHSAMLPADMRQGAPIEINFASVQDVRDQASRVWIRAADQHASMPPVGPAPDQERALLGEWLACGAPTDADIDAR